MPEWKLIWIERLIVSDAVRRKIEIKHGIDVDWIVDNLERNSRIKALSIHDAMRGSRIKIKLESLHQQRLHIYISLSINNYAEYNLITAFRSSKFNRRGR